MSMNRRGFLGTLLAIVGTTAIDPKALLWAPTPESVEVLTPEAICTLERITLEMLRAIENIYGVSVPSHSSIRRLGDTLPNGWTLSNHCGVSMATPDEIDKYGLDTERYITPMARLLARKAGKVKACAPMVLPREVDQAYRATSPKSGFSVRGLMVYDPVFDEHNLRFDMLVAS